MQARITNGTPTWTSITMTTTVPSLGIMLMGPTTWMMGITTRMRVRTFRMV